MKIEIDTDDIQSLKKLEAELERALSLVRLAIGQCGGVSRGLPRLEPQLKEPSTEPPAPPPSRPRVPQVVHLPEAAQAALDAQREALIAECQWLKEVPERFTTGEAAGAVGEAKASYATRRQLRDLVRRKVIAILDQGQGRNETLYAKLG